MGKVKQDSIDKPLPDITDMYPDLHVRVYVANDLYVTREVFIMQLALELYNCPEIPDIRGAIDLLLRDEKADELLCFADKNFFSFMTTRTCMDSEVTIKNPNQLTDEELTIFHNRKEHIAQIAKFRAEGLTDDQIVERLGIDVNNMSKTCSFTLPSRIKDVENRPLRQYDVSCDIEIKSAIPKIFQHGQKKWKRIKEIVTAASFKESKEKFKVDLLKRYPEQKTKNFESTISVKGKQENVQE